MSASVPIIAQIVTLSGNQVGLLVAQPNWETEVTIALDLPTDIEKDAITFTESRRAFAQSARYSMQWRAYLANAKDATELRIFLRRIRGELIIAPLWPDMCEIQTAVPVGGTQIHLIDTPARFGAEWIIANDDFSTWEIVAVSGINFSTRIASLVPGTHHAWPAGSFMYPLIAGRLSEQPQPEAITDECLEVDLKIKENSNFAARISTQAGANKVVGNNVPPFRTTPLLDIAPNFSRPLDWTEPSDVVYQLIGFLREEQKRIYDHRNARGMELEYYESTRANIAKLERFWRNQRGPVLRFMMPTWKGDMRMRRDTPVPFAPNRIAVEDTEFCNPGREAQPGDPFVALIDSNNAVDPRLISSAQGVAGQMVLNASTPLSAHTAASTILSHLLLARFVDPHLEWSYTTPYLATTRVKCVELPHEYANTPAALPEPAYLFIFTEVGVRTDRYTSYENTITVPSGPYAGTYTPAPFSFDTVKTGLKLDQEQLSLKSFKFIGNPLNKMWPFALDGLLQLEIVEVTVTTPAASAVSRFFGDVWSVDSDYNATIIAFGNLFDRKFPRFLLSVTDNYTQFSPPTQLNAAAFKITGTLASSSGQTITATSAAAHAKEADYFAGGWLEIGTGVNLEKRGILHSEPAPSNKVTLHIDRPLIKNAIVGDTGAALGPGSGIDVPVPLPPDTSTISLYPGYDGSIDQCESRFNNRVNFGGHPFIPNVNPAVKAMKAKNVQGGKK
jgi:hypothetical protein